MKRKPSIEGFTLVEMVMVIVIIGVLAVSVGPRFFSVTTYEERFYTEDLLTALRYAHRVAENSNCVVRFSVASNGFQMAQDGNCFNASAANFNMNVFRPSEPDIPFNSVDKPASLLQSSTTSPFFFQPNGNILDSSSTLATVTVSLTGLEVTTTLQIDGYTGYVSKI